MTLDILIILFLLIGCISGMLAGLFGIGGGIVIVPILLFIFPILKIPDSIQMQMAVATSLTTIIATSIVSTYAQYKKKAVLGAVFIQLLPGIIGGTLIGSYLALYLESQVLRFIFSLFLLIVAIKMLFDLPLTGEQRNLPTKQGLFVIATAIGSLSALVGIGGGTMTVPFLHACKVNMLNAIATSSAVGIPIALVGMSVFLLNTPPIPQLPAWSSGYIFWPAVIGITLTSVLFAPLGVALAHFLPAKLLKRIFAVFLFIVSIRLGRL